MAPSALLYYSFIATNIKGKKFSANIAYSLKSGLKYAINRLTVGIWGCFRGAEGTMKFFRISTGLDIFAF